MQEFVYNQFVTIFGSGLIEKTSELAQAFMPFALLN